MIMGMVDQQRVTLMDMPTDMKHTEACFSKIPITRAGREGGREGGRPGERELEKERQTDRTKTKINSKLHVWSNVKNSYMHAIIVMAICCYENNASYDKA